MGRNRKSSIISILLTTLILSYYAGATLFSHTHIYEWGKVTHSHPYLPSSSHSHSTASLQTIDNLSHIDVAIPLTLSIVVSVIAGTLMYTAPKCWYVTYGTRYYNLRAPPVSL